MTEVKFLNGLTTIGGNIMEISTDNSRVICDFGTVSEIPNNYRVAEEIRKHHFPNLSDIFKGSDSEFENEAIFISHLHLDHTGALPYVDTDIPIYLSEKSYELYQNLLNSGLAQEISGNIHTYKAETVVNIGNLTVTGYVSDHDVIDPMALLISDGKNNFGYSGDVRLHGPKRDEVEKWLKIFHDKQLQLFMIEGTAFSFDNLPHSQRESELSEVDIIKQLKGLLDDNNSGLIAINLYPRNVERLMRFVRVTNNSSRKIVWELAFAKVIHQFYPTLKLSVLEESVDWAETVTINEIKTNSKQYILQNSFVNLHNLDVFQNVIYIHSNGEPLGEYDSRYQQLINYLTQRNFQLKKLEASGHAKKNDLVKMVDSVAAEQTVLWHSFHPELERDAMKIHHVNSRILLPDRENVYKFK